MIHDKEVAYEIFYLRNRERSSRKQVDLTEERNLYRKNYQQQLQKAEKEDIQLTSQQESQKEPQLETEKKVQQEIGKT